MARSIPGILLFEQDSYKQRFLAEIAKAIRTHVAELYSFCVMTNHFHLLLSTERVPVGRLVQPAMAIVAQRWNWEHQRKGPIYDDRAKAKAVTTDRYFLNAARYIEYNPVKAGIVERPEQYPWSSARAYVSGDSDNLTSTERLLASLSKLDVPVDYRRWLGSAERAAWPYPDEPEWESSPEPTSAAPAIPPALLQLAEEVATRHDVPLPEFLGPASRHALAAARREFIWQGSARGFTGAAIARMLGRSKALVSRELARKKVNGGDCPQG